MATSETVDRSPALRRVESVPADATVRHVDQLGESALTWFLEALEAGPTPTAGPIGLEDGDVIVFTACYRIDRS
ncbi:hypothetical protein HALLA_16885 [Halostagnicola larsenii XH-48]|uniref:Uncharacterized protein n=1 Tax=Halostagnicola larsenii XH-48 TaxID=797299 RepID=W0JSG4_9EURY|nr:hypothetical protein [Halostagnicola larsenii]AHG00227.1 hypothetical protein HALLA_16885 [Halostagnicola larsenii XH-48]